MAGWVSGHIPRAAAIQEALGLKISQFVGLMGDKPESQEDRVIAQNVASKHMDVVIDKLKELGEPKNCLKVTNKEVC